MTRVLTAAWIVWIEMLRRKDFYVLALLLAAGMLLLVSLNVMGLGSVPGYVADIGLLLAWVLSWILSINIACRQIPQERQRGTIHALLARPVGRGELLIGKWLGAWSAVAVATLSFYALVILVGLAFGGRFEPVSLVQAVLLHGVLLAMLCAMALALSIRMDHDAAATLAYVLSAAVFVFVPRIPEFVEGAGGWRETAMLFLYVALPHFELFDMRQRVVHLHGPIRWPVWGMIAVYGLLLTAALLAAAWLAFRRQRFSRLSRE